MAVGSPYLLGVGSGGLHVYELQGSGLFVQVASFAPRTHPSGRFLGASVAVEGGLIAAGAVGNEVNNERGEVRLYQRSGSGWSEVATFAASGDERRFGHDVALAGGALYATGKASASARRYELGPGGWALAHQYTTVAGVAGHAPFGARVRVASGRVVVSDPEGVTVAPRDQVASVDLGCDARPTPPTAYWFSGPRFLLDVAGELRRSNPTLAFTVRAEAFGPYPVGSGLLFFGTTAASMPLGSAQLCVGGALRRAALGAPTPGTTATELTLDLHAPGVAPGLLPGTPLHFQYWFRIAGGSHLTNSLVLTLCP